MNALLLIMRLLPKIQGVGDPLLLPSAKESDRRLAELTAEVNKALAEGYAIREFQTVDHGSLVVYSYLLERKGQVQPSKPLQPPAIDPPMPGTMPKAEEPVKQQPATTAVTEAPY